MNKLTLLAFSMLALAACDKIPFLGGGKVEANGSVAAGNGAAPANAANAVADAGVTSSRSLAGLAGAEGGGDTGGKDPSTSDAIPVSSSQGIVDPRLVGSWSDSGKCNDAAELRADGTFVANNGTTGRWRVVGDELVFTGNGVFRLHLDSVEPDRIVTTTPQGQTGPSIRC